jgi:hypothetical protein
MSAYILIIPLIRLAISLSLSGLATLFGRSSYHRWSLTPERRVGHRLCDSGEDYNFGFILLMCLLLMPISYSAWTDHEHSGFLLWLGRFMGLLLGAFAIRSITLLVINEVQKAAIGRHISEERRRWDPESKNPKLYVIRRDIEPICVALFDRISRRCYERGISVLQYTEMEWPRYRHRVAPYALSFASSIATPVPNPESVGKASAVVWLDMGVPSEAVILELECANKLGLPVIRFAPRDGEEDEFMIEFQARTIVVSSLPEAEKALLAVLAGVIGGPWCPLYYRQLGCRQCRGTPCLRLHDGAVIPLLNWRPTC